METKYFPKRPVVTLRNGIPENTGGEPSWKNQHLPKRPEITSSTAVEQSSWVSARGADVPTSWVPVHFDLTAVHGREHSASNRTWYEAAEPHSGKEGICREHGVPARGPYQARFSDKTTSCRNQDPARMYRNTYNRKIAM